MMEGHGESNIFTFSKRGYNKIKIRLLSSMLISSHEGCPPPPLILSKSKTLMYQVTPVGIISAYGIICGITSESRLLLRLSKTGLEDHSRQS